MKIIVTLFLAFLMSCTTMHHDPQELDIIIGIAGDCPSCNRYLVNGNKVEVVGPFDDKPQYTRKLSSKEKIALIKFLEKCNLGNLKECYKEPDVFVLDGYFVTYKIKLNGTEYEICTNNVYQPTMISICKKINEFLPSEHQIWTPSAPDSQFPLVE